MVKKTSKTITERIDDLIKDSLPSIMQDIMDEEDVPVETKAARVQLLQTALHHLKLLRGAYE